MPRRIICCICARWHGWVCVCVGDTICSVARCVAAGIEHFTSYCIKTCPWFLTHVAPLLHVHGIGTIMVHCCIACPCCCVTRLIDRSRMCGCVLFVKDVHTVVRQHHFDANTACSLHAWTSLRNCTIAIVGYALEFRVMLSCLCTCVKQINVWSIHARLGTANPWLFKP